MQSGAMAPGVTIVTWSLTANSGVCRARRRTTRLPLQTGVMAPGVTFVTWSLAANSPTNSQ